MRRTVVVAMASANWRQSLIQLLDSAGWRVRVCEVDATSVVRACSEAGARIVFIELVQGQEGGVGGAAMANAAMDGESKRRVEIVDSIRQHTVVPLVAVSSEGSTEAIVGAMKAGAADYIVMAEGTRGTTRLNEQVLRATGHALIEESQSPIEMRIAGTSDAARVMRSRLQGLAPLRSPVLILGEAGTGRDSVAHAIHEAGPGASDPFKRIDGARWRPSEEGPARGTLYLDRADHLSPGGQKYWGHRLLELARDGFRTGPRIIASTGLGFSARPQCGSGPADVTQPLIDEALHQQLMRFPLELIPLRDRREDIPIIANHIVSRLGKAMQREVRLSGNAEAFLVTQGWPGNVAQLSRLLERAVAFCSGGLIHKADVEQLADAFEESLSAIRRQKGVAEREELIETLSRTGGNISRCAEEMGRSRGAIYRLIDKYGVALPRPNGRSHTAER